MPRPLTPKQEAFAHYFVETGNASEAYRRAYDADSMSLPAVWVEASRTLALPHVALLIDELKTTQLQAVDVTATDIVREAWKIARAEDSPTAARVSALALLAKRHPEFSDKHDVRVDQRTQALLAVSQMPLEQLLALAEGVEHDGN